METQKVGAGRGVAGEVNESNKFYISLESFFFVRGWAGSASE